jgi:hypothetical protein
MPNPWNVRHLFLDFTPVFDLVDGTVVRVDLRLVDAVEEDSVVLLVDGQFLQWSGEQQAQAYRSLGCLASCLRRSSVPLVSSQNNNQIQITSILTLVLS